jgi:hypothetical protein
MAINSVNILETDTVLLSVPAGKKYAVTTILFSNYSTSTTSVNDSSFDMHVIQGAGGLKSDTNKVLNNVSMPAQETFSFNIERLILEEGDRIVVISPDSDKLNATISYLEV